MQRWWLLPIRIMQSIWIPCPHNLIRKLFTIFRRLRDQGQRYQIFAIARIDGRYRGLAVLHNPWHFGNIALRRCIALQRVFWAEENRVAIQPDLIVAQRCDENFWSSKSGDPFATSDTISPESYGECVAPFPFITTHLVLGTSFDPADGYQARVPLLDFNVDSIAGDNNDGITVLDVTDPKNARCCFVNFQDKLEQDQRSQNGG